MNQRFATSLGIVAFAGIILVDNCCNASSIIDMLNDFMGQDMFTYDVVTPDDSKRLREAPTTFTLPSKINDSVLLGQHSHKPKNIPDKRLHALEIIRRHGYPSESHVILTEDGYLLTLHRIPHGKNRPRGGQPIFLQHGLLCSSGDFVDGGNKSLAFFLADNGYDVWMGNARGNLYSRAHISLPVDTDEFWDFSFHEMGLKDLPAAFDYVSSATDQGGNIIYIGHSMGTTMFFVLASLKPDITTKYIVMMVALAPIAYMTDVFTPMKYLLLPFVDGIAWLRKHMAFRAIMADPHIRRILSYKCSYGTINARLCVEFIFLLTGFDPAGFDMADLPVILHQTPAGTSVKTVLHYAKEINNGGKFQWYDYGTKENLKRYAAKTPPSYVVSNIKVPTILMYSDNDWLAGVKDVLRLSQELSNNIVAYEVPRKRFNHLDYLWGKDAPKLVYLPMLNYIKQFG